jgi:DNA (cytosine-5)-methyltransferase 1
MKTEPPTLAEISEARARAGLSKAAAAELIHAHEQSWVKWERGERPMHPAFWELFLLKARLMRLPKPKPEPKPKRIPFPKAKA